jgi:transposase
VCDNLKSGVTKACRYEPELNPTYADMAAHYSCAVIPARVRKPRDKAKVESAVQQVERWVIAPLRKRTFHSLYEANAAIRERLEWLNNRVMKGLGASRAELFGQFDLPALRPLPEKPFEFEAPLKRARVNIDYHVAAGGNFYSVSYRLVGEEVEVRLAEGTVEIFYKGRRVASHVRSRGKGQFVTSKEHMPASHRAHLEWTPSRIVAWAQETGPETARLVEAIMEAKPHPEMGYRSCLGIIRLAGSYGSDRMEAAAHRALSVGAVSYKSVKSILSSGLDRVDEQEGDNGAIPPHGNVRGPDYYN